MDDRLSAGFNLIKSEIVNSPAIAFLDLHLETNVTMDDSGYGIGAVMTHNEVMVLHFNDAMCVLHFNDALCVLHFFDALCSAF